MSTIYTEIKNPPKFKPTPRLRVTIDPACISDLPFPSDYKYSSCLLTKKFAQYIDRIGNFEVRPDDIWVLGFPKSGTTWMQNILYQLKIKQMKFAEYFNDPSKHAFEAPYYFEADDGEDDVNTLNIVAEREKMYDVMDALPSPRMIKCHLPAYLLPKQIWTVQPKLVHISRNPKDVAVSYFHMSRDFIIPYSGSMSELFNDFRNDSVLFGPYHQQIHSFYQLRHLKHLLLLTYEELSAHPFEVVKRLSEFLECSYSDEQLHQLIEYTSFGKMRDKIEFPSKNPDYKFCRKGKVGDYRNNMSEEEIKQFDEWIAKNKNELNLP